ncbi:MAG: peptidyl-prolyl cis-trans isomerase [Parvularculaceae bacterium]
MLKWIRSAISGWVAYLIVGVVFVAFSFVGIGQIGNLFGSSALKVGSSKFSIQEVSREFDRQLNGIQRQNTGAIISREQAVEQGLVDQVITVMKSRASLNEDSRELGLTATAAMVQAYLQADEKFQNPTSGKFDQEALGSILRENSISIGEFRSLIKEEMVRNQMAQSIAAPMPASDTLLNAVILRNGETRSVTYINVDKTRIADVAVPDQAALEAWYQQNISQFTAPEFRSFTVSTLTRETFAAGIEVSETELREEYDARKDQINEPELRTIRQLTARTKTDADALAARLAAGESLPALVQERGLSLDAVTLSDKTQSALGELGEAAFGAAKGSFTAPIETALGYTLVEVISITPGKIVTFEEAKTQLRDDIAAEEAERALFAAIEEVELARDEGATISDAIEAIPEAKTVRYGPVDDKFFTPGGAILNDLSAAALSEAFSLQVGDESDVLDTDDGTGYYFVILDDITPPTAQPLADVVEQVTIGWRAQQTNALVTAKIAELRGKLAGGAPLSQIASEAGIDLQTMNINRSLPNNIMATELVSDLFITDINAIATGNTATGSGQIIAQVNSASLQPLPKDPATLGQTRIQLGQILGREFYEAYLATLDSELGVKVNQGQLAQAFGLDAPQ